MLKTIIRTHLNVGERLEYHPCIGLASYVVLFNIRDHYVGVRVGNQVRAETDMGVTWYGYNV